MQTTAYGTTEYVSFTANDSRGNFVSCYSDKPSIVSAAKSLHGDAYVSVNYDTDGQCTQVSIFNGSYFDPKAH